MNISSSSGTYLFINYKRKFATSMLKHIDIFFCRFFKDVMMNVGKITQKTDGFKVFRVDTICGHLTNTQDIGDLCIFLGHGEAYCVPASSSPGLRPNSIYYVGCNFGVHDIATDTTTNFYTHSNVPLRSTEFPYWPLPLS